MLFKKGDKISWCDETYEVIEVYNEDSGKVKDCSGQVINNFKFNYGGDISKIKMGD